MISQIPYVVLLVWNFTILYLVEFQKGLETILLIVSIIITILKIFDWFKSHFQKKRKKKDG